MIEFVWRASTSCLNGHDILVCQVVMDMLHDGIDESVQYEAS